MFSKSQFVRICLMQDALNNVAAGTDWKDKHLPWDTAVVREGGEALDHIGWEWWKAVTPNIEQAKLEVVDMLHFAISGSLVQKLLPEEMYDATQVALKGMDNETLDQLNNWQATDFIKEAIVTAIVRNYGFTVFLVVRAAQALGMSTDELFNAYVGKNVLNRFRKANGYKEGTYIKIWNGKEDNEHLTEFLAVLDPSDSEFEIKIEGHLSALYSIVKAQTQPH